MDRDVLTDIEIDRPRFEVADYVSNPENATAWYQNINKVELKTPKPLSGGRAPGTVPGEDYTGSPPPGSLMDVAGDGRRAPRRSA